jgi:predicted CopG family antitoxin
VEKMVCGHIKTKEQEFSNVMEALTEKEKEQALNILKKIRKKMERE